MTGHDDPAAVLTRLLHAIDTLRWPAVRGCLADQVRTDYTELFGGEPQDVTGDELVTTWQGLLPGFDATQHLTGPVLAESDGATGTVRLAAHVRAYHYLTTTEGPQTWGVHGHYQVTLDREHRIRELTLRVFHQDGDPALTATAAERAVVAPRRTRPEP